MDPDAVSVYDFDFDPDKNPFLNGATISAASVVEETDTPILTIGDGSTAKVDPEVGTVTPDAPTIISGVVRFWAWAQSSVESGTAIVRCRVRLSDKRIDDRSMSISIAER